MHQRVAMQFLPFGYCGMSDVGDGQFNLCLVARPEHPAYEVLRPVTVRTPFATTSV